MFIHIKFEKMFGETNFTFTIHLLIVCPNVYFMILSNQWYSPHVDIIHILLFAQTRIFYQSQKCCVLFLSCLLLMVFFSRVVWSVKKYTLTLYDLLRYFNMLVKNSPLELFTHVKSINVIILTKNNYVNRLDTRTY